MFIKVLRILTPLQNKIDESALCLQLAWPHGGQAIPRHSEDPNSFT